MNMKTSTTVISLTAFILLTVELGHGRVVRDRKSDSTGLLLSALCIEDGTLRPACVEEVSTLSIQNILGKLAAQVRNDQSYKDFLRQLQLDGEDEDETSAEDLVPEKRGRPRQASSFYSNW